MTQSFPEESHWLRPIYNEPRANGRGPDQVWTCLKRIGKRIWTAMKSPVVKRTVVINHQKTSITLEKEFCVALKEIADLQKTNSNHLITQIDEKRELSNLSSAVRLFVFSFYKTRQPEPVLKAEIESRVGKNRDS